MYLERYNRSFEDHVSSIEEEADARLQSFRQRCVRQFINRLTRQHDEWDKTFREILKKSHQEVTFAEKPMIKLIDDQQPVQIVETKPPTQSIVIQQPAPVEPLIDKAQDSTDATQEVKSKDDTISKKSKDPFPEDARDYFTNNLALQEFIRIQEQQEQNRQKLHELNTDSSLKPFKNELNLFVRTQINSISNSDSHHINTKTLKMTKFFTGQTIEFQDRYISAAKHPQGQLLAMDLAAQTFVTVGTRLVNSVPAIAKSMASVINGIVRNDIPIFRDFVVGHIQERCPFLIPMYPDLSDFGTQEESKIKYMIACGYSQDIKTKALESEEKYLARMRSMALVYACILIQHDNKGLAWSWLVSFLSLEPRPLITATILQAFLQETSRPLTQIFGKQFKKLVKFMQTEYFEMMENVTERGQRQSLIKLKNQLDDDLNENFHN